jgi:hypothetical protein
VVPVLSAGGRKNSHNNSNSSPFTSGCNVYFLCFELKKESSKLDPADMLFLGYNEQKKTRKNVEKYKNTYVIM